MMGEFEVLHVVSSCGDLLVGLGRLRGWVVIGRGWGCGCGGCAGGGWDGFAEEAVFETPFSDVEGLVALS